MSLLTVVVFTGERHTHIMPISLTQQWDVLSQGVDANYRKWPQEFFYTLEAPKGHLPLTNALRGTQLLQAILEHPAFVKESKSGSSSNGQPDWMN